LKGEGEFDFLRTLALSLGAAEARVILAEDVVVENRVVLKCRVGCDDYGKKLTCPPYTPKVDEFRKMLKDYRHAMVVKFKSPAEADKDTSRSLLRSQYDPTMSRDLREKASKFWSDWKSDKKRILLAVLELERAAFNRGYTFAVGSPQVLAVCARNATCKLGYASIRVWLVVRNTQSE
jgi:predicted metal-binding protein